MEKAWKLITPSVIQTVKVKSSNELSIPVYITVHVVNENTKIIIILFLHKQIKARLWGCDRYLIVRILFIDKSS